MSDILAGRRNSDEHTAGKILVDDKLIVVIRIIDVGRNRLDKDLCSTVVFAVDDIFLVDGIFADLILSSKAIVRIVGDSTSGNIEGDCI